MMNAMWHSTPSPSVAGWLLLAIDLVIASPADQMFLGRPVPGTTEHGTSYLDVGPFSRGQHTRTKQTDEICKTYGEEQWTGTIDVSDERRLFYWFFESRNHPETDPVIIWMNGGPGGSSMEGLLTEMGPCTLDPDSKVTVANPHSWNNNASVLFIEQPAGTGFSPLGDGAPYPSTDLGGAVDFQTFLNVFFTDIFPQYAKSQMHVVGESYGGHYAPTYVHHILESRRHNSRDAFMGEIDSIVLVNGMLDLFSVMAGSYELLCTEFRGPILNETACQNMARRLPECIRLGQTCQQTDDIELCNTAAAYCMTEVGQYFREEQLSGHRNPANIQLPCTNLPICEDVSGGNATAFLNQRHVLSALGFSPSFVYHAINFELNAGFKDITRTMYRIMESLLEWPADQDGKRVSPRILVMNGNEDYTVNTPGQIITYDNLLWSGQADFRTAPFHRWSADEYTEVGKRQFFEGSGFWKGTKDRHLVLVGLDNAGHEVPRHQPLASFSIMREWLGNWKI